jgi:chemotaxis signal transduction protein
VLGVINLRGNIVPIVDIRPALSLPPASGIGQVAVIHFEQITIGIVVDAVAEVVPVPVRDILPLPAEATVKDEGARNRSRYLQAIIQRPNGIAALLNIERILESISLS